MSNRLRLHSLLAHFALRVIAPLTLVMVVMIAAGLYAYQQTITSLLIDRDQQLAVLSAAQLSEAMAGYARELGKPAQIPFVAQNVKLGLKPVWSRGPLTASGLLEIFTAGVVAVNAEGQVVDVTPWSISSPVGETVAEQDYFRSVHQHLTPIFSDVVIDTRTGQNMIVIAMPILDDQKEFVGALLGAVDLRNTALSEPINNLRIGDGGIAYLVDGTGRVIFHPDASRIGADFGDRPFVENVIAGKSGGTLWRVPTTGEQVVQGYAPVAGTGWGLIVREPWASVVDPIQVYGLLMALVALTTVGVTIYFLWQGVRRIAGPLQLLVSQTVRLATGEVVEPLVASGIREIDALEQAFNQMATQIATYRAGLRRYVEAITQSQEDERRRIARDLHDETIQSLLTVARRLELYQASESNPERLAQLAELQALVTSTVQGVRQISRDLRPLMLEDLGLVPALRTLIRAAREGEDAASVVRFEVAGQPVSLTAEQEIAIYRITQEALTNVRKHAHAAEICVDLAFESTLVRLDIIDNGQGFKVPDSLTELAQRDSFGLIGIQERVRAIGGSLTIKSEPGRGTHLNVAMPFGNGHRA